MTNTGNMAIREVTPDDDFDFLLQLVNDTMRRYMLSSDLFTGLGISAAQLKQRSADQKIFVAIADNKIVALGNVRLSSTSKNGFLTYGYLEDYESALQKLIKQCEDYVASFGGKKLFAYAHTKFGQVRNQQISLLERLGFVPDEFSYMTCELSLNGWTVPDHFKADHIDPITTMETEHIHHILLEDGEDEMAELFVRQFPPGQPRNRVVLRMTDPDSSEITGIAYYEVSSHPISEGEFQFNASAFGLHFRPDAHVSTEDKTQLLQASLQSMKQLHVEHVLTKMTLKHFDVFAAMIKEGFTNDNLEELNTLRMTKNV